MSARFQILSLSGGGYRGLYTATILANLEQSIGRPLARCFDLIAGTSAGGILALGLALEVPASRLAELFADHGGEIFRRQRSLFGFLKAKYGSINLQNLLAQPTLFGNRVLGCSHHRVVVPAINYSSGLPVVFKTAHHPTFVTDHRRSVIDIALATSAAPFYFRRHRLDYNQYVDGGLFANAPGLVALHEAEHFLSAELENVHLLSIGTMTSRFTVNPQRSNAGGILDWGRGSPLKAAQRLFGITISVQESLTDSILEHRLRQARYIKLDDVLTPDRADAVRLDKTDAAAREVLIGSGKERAKHALGDSRVAAILSHMAPTAHFYHGEHALPQTGSSHAQSTPTPV
jgi:predicted acylesterase/phospholipase RssA